MHKAGVHGMGAWQVFGQWPFGICFPPYRHLIAVGQHRDIGERRADTDAVQCVLLGCGESREQLPLHLASW